MKIIEKQVNDYLSKSKLPDADFVINPYIGCTNACKYCYASFMKRFTGHTEDWGDFLDVKICEKPIDIKKIQNKKVFLGSVTDCYNEAEKQYQITQKILKQLIGADAEISISTKSKLIVRDVEILKRIKNIVVAFSINTLDENFKNDMDCASSIHDRIAAMKTLHENGIKTVCFVSPIFPGITNFEAIIESTKDFCDEYWFENLNLRGAYKKTILNYINLKYPNLFNIYDEIYNQNNKTYWINLAQQIDDYCNDNQIKFKNYFYHDLIRKN